ncbi:unnamed protein product [Macrosiphum euphorbiae]|uniref:Uncharacterized protein n=1 Tax=Macrosiphum euphorbiae TaxID=13131 RepID=A0AAV0XXX6_9HEMI|nr:unnamed protein product [Macrosiphum euphorbiae]
MSNRNNNNINNKGISKMKNTVSPVTFSKNKTPNSSLGTSNNQPDVGWIIKQSKRNLSSSTNSEPNSPREQLSNTKKKYSNQQISKSL